ncbi:MAG: hypothetical protein P0S94_00510 [Simkaniaceae bacterium]|nr:hypothetical protein [Simkaniaceae bacterium]
MVYLLEKHHYGITDGTYSNLDTAHMDYTGIAKGFFEKKYHVSMAYLETVSYLGNLIKLAEAFFAQLIMSIAGPTLILDRIQQTDEESGNNVREYTFDPPENIEKSVEWPANLIEYNLTADEKNIIDTHLTKALNSPRIHIGKKMITYFDTSSEHYGEVVQAKLPASVTFLSEPDGYTVNCFLLSKNVLAKGGERTVKRAWDLTSGKAYVKKPLLDKLEKDIYIPMNESHFGYRLREVKGKTNNQKIQVLEPLAKGALDSILLDSNTTLSLEDRLKMPSSLLQQLKSLHSLTITPENSNPYPLFHQDISADNILLDRDENQQWSAQLTDFGAAGRISSAICKKFYLPPEYTTFFMQNGIFNSTNMSDVTCNELEKFNRDHAQARDIWSMGLVIFTLLRGKMGLLKYNTLDYAVPFVNSLRYYWHDLFSNARTIRLPNQDDINQEICELTGELLALVDQNDITMRTKIYDLCDVLLNMLRVDPKERETAEHIYHYLNPPRLTSLDHYLYTRESCDKESKRLENLRKESQLQIHVNRPPECKHDRFGFSL